MAFIKAKRTGIYPKVALISPSGGGKTYSALRLATGMQKQLQEDGIETRIAFIGTESSRDVIYADEFDYDILQLKPPFTPESFVKAIKEAEQAGYKVLVLDSITHEWKGTGGILEIHSKVPGSNTYTNWKEVTPRHNKFIDAIIDSSIFIIATVRGKDSYELEEVDGKKIPKKMAIGYEQRSDLEYSFTSAFDIDLKNHTAKTVKDNTHLFEDDFEEALTEEHGRQIAIWACGGDIEAKIAEMAASVAEGRRLQELNERAEAEEMARLNGPAKVDTKPLPPIVLPKELKINVIAPVVKAVIETVVETPTLIVSPISTNPPIIIPPTSAINNAPRMESVVTTKQSADELLASIRESFSTLKLTMSKDEILAIMERDGGTNKPTLTTSLDILNKIDDRLTRLVEEM